MLIVSDHILRFGLLYAKDHDHDARTFWHKGNHIFSSADHSDLNNASRCLNVNDN